MADSCRPVSRHGRYSATHNRTDVQYTDNLPSYSTVGYRAHEDVYGTRKSPVVMETLDRPKTGRGFRRVRPPSRGGREEVFDETKTGRPSSRVGFRPDTYDRHDYDMYSRQEQPVISDDSDSTDSSPRGGNNSPAYINSPSGYRRTSPSQKHVGRMSVSPHEEYLSANSPSALRLLSRDTFHQQTPIRSPPQDHKPRQTYSYSPVHQGHQDNYGNAEQVFDFEEESLNHRQTERYQPHFQNEQYQYVDTQDEQSYGDCVPPSRDSPRSRNQSYGDCRPPSRDSPRSRNHHKTENVMPSSNYTPILSGKNRYEYEHYHHEDHSNKHDSEVFPVHDEPTPRPPSGSSRPRSSRPKSARRRPQSGRKQKEYQEDSQNQEYDPNSSAVRPHSSFLRYKPLPAIGSNETMSNQERAEELAEQTRHLHIQESYQPRPESARNRPGSARNRPGSASYRWPESASGISQPFSSAREMLYEGHHVSAHSGGHTLQASVKNDSDNETETNQSEERTHQGDSNAFRPHKLPDEPKDNEIRLLLAIRLPDGKRVQRYFRVADKLELVQQYAENEACFDLSNYELSCNSPKAVFTNLSQLICDAGLEDRTLLFLKEKL